MHHIADLLARLWNLSQAAVGDLTRAHATFVRMRAVGAWQMHHFGSGRIVNVLLDAYGADFEAAWQWCGVSLFIQLGPARQNMLMMAHS
jgi:hypothetical protein